MILDQSELTKIDHFLNQYKVQWKNTQTLDDKEVFRLAILRDLSHHIHSERSMALANQETLNTETLHQIDETIKTKEIPLDVLDLDIALQSPHLKERKPIAINLPTELTHLMSIETFDRYDLFWEKLILNEALNRKWSIYFTQVTADINETEIKLQSLKQTLWPNGVFITSKTFEVNNARWSGGWLIVTFSHYTPRLDPTLQFVRIDKS